MFNCNTGSTLKILPYSESALSEVLSNEYTPPGVISKKNHFQYLKGYLTNPQINAKTIVIEEKYINKDFLHDLASYYVLCFKPYEKFCKRVHFFNHTFSEEEFKNVLLSPEGEKTDFWSHYLGFIVVKPIPITVIGYSVLKTYSHSDHLDDRNFWGLREYTVHFFGNKLTIESLAFQEQDSVLAACATTAIWTMLNKASLNQDTILKSPSQITKDADVVSPDGSRLFPNKGLDLLQICKAILNSGLVSEVKQPDFELKDSTGKSLKKILSIQYLKKVLNAYSPIGIPIILVIGVPNGPQYGLHAITISGFKKSQPKTIPPRTEISWFADNIDKLYAHDDQWGPFTRIEFEDEWKLITPWTALDGSHRPTMGMNIIVPVYPKIRISYEDVEVVVLGLDTILSLFFDKKNKEDLVWDVQITYSERIKSQIKSSALDRSEKINFLTTSLPKYMWVASCHVGHTKILDFLFDATDVSNGMTGLKVFCYLNSDFKLLLSDFLKSNRSLLESLLKHQAQSLYYDFIINQLLF